MRLGIISDTHNILREEVAEYLKTCDLILHAGDLCKLEILNQLKGIGTVYAVRGNNDKGEWAMKIPKQMIIELKGYKIGMAHEKKDLTQIRGI
ncbi:metallophosphoesterase family protein [Cellulosilyticum ruminicola]|uniref:metallophosphoesterase family protein n=1 Tax=Cellulosilyticum ruminicola TaxID=425254 RepID=UPI0006D0CD18|nr:metallophosphoesterase family protein [Cellulosilyticum ruminicola]